MTRRWMAVIAASVVLAAASLGARAEETKAQPRPDNAFANKFYATDVTEQKKTFACFVRTYDRDHLAQHSKQKVTAMKLLVTAEKDPEDGILNHSFSLGVKLRNRPENFSSGGGCGHVKPADSEISKEHLGCNVDCEGGGLDVELSADAKSTTVRVGSVRIWNYKKPAEDGFYLEGGADDRVFRLDRAPLEMCKSLAEDRDELAEMMAQAKKRVSAVK